MDVIPEFLPEQFDLPEELRPIVATVPLYISRREAADLVSKYFFRVSHQTIARWGLPMWHLAGRPRLQTAEVLSVAWEKVRAAEAA